MQHLMVIALSLSIGCRVNNFISKGVDKGGGG